VLSTSVRQRAQQATDYFGRLKHHHSVAEKGISAEARTSFHRAVLASAFAGSAGLPDPAGWNVVLREPAAGATGAAAQAKFEYVHVHFARRKKFFNLVTLGRALAEAVFAAAHELPDGDNQPTSPRRADEEEPVEYDGTRALAQVEQVVSKDGTHTAGKKLQVRGRPRLTALRIPQASSGSSRAGWRVR
jgi:hypothetical protein